MRIGYLGAGTWGVSLVSLLAKKGYRVRVWARNAQIVDALNATKQHPHLQGYPVEGDVVFTTNMAEAIEGADLICESVTASGLRMVFQQLKKLNPPKCPIVLTSKGIERDSGMLLGEVAIDVLGEEYKNYIGYLSGPSHAEEVIKGVPTTVVCSAFNPSIIPAILDAFTNDFFRVYPNTDMRGVEFGGAMKNIIAIAAGMSDGLGYGDNSKAALLTRGLHEIRKLAVACGCRQETLNGLAGLGDLCVTCFSTLSRNYRFGKLLVEGYSANQAKEKIGEVVEGAYSCISALQLAKKKSVVLPIADAVQKIIYEGLHPEDAVKALLQRTVKEEHL